MKRHAVALMVALGAGTLVIGVPPVLAATFVVDTTADDPDLVVGDGVCAAASRRCSLRAALDEANALPGSDEVVLPRGDFDLRGPGLAIADDLVLTGAGAKATRLLARNRENVLRIVGSPVVVIADLRLEGGRAARGAGIDNPAATLTLTRVHLLFNRAADGRGGALYNGGTARLDQVTMTGNVARAGGAIYNAASGDLRVVDSTLRRNRHRVPGGGGCLRNAGVAIVERSLFARCQGRIGDGGGGILNSGTLGLTNSTLWGCRARLGQGGAIVNQPGALLDIENATIIRNQAAFVAGGIVNDGGAFIRNSIVWGNVSRERDANCGGFAPLLSLGYNLDGGSSCGFAEVGDIDRSDPRVGRDNDNGGPTRTREIRSGSPAVDAIGDAWCPATDQRGMARPADGDGDGDGRCDIGAFECVAPVTTSAAAMAVPGPGIEAPEFQANALGAAHQRVPVVATLPEGDLFVAWQSGGEPDGDGEDLVAQRFDAFGNRIGDPFRLNEAIVGDQTAPAVAATGETVVAVWESLAGAAGAEQAIVLRRFGRDGVPLGGDVRVDPDGGIASMPAVAVDATAAASVAWLDGATGADSLWLRRVLPDGSASAAAVAVDDGGTSELTAPAVAVGNDGRRLVVWSGERDERPGVFARLFDGEERALSGVIVVWQPDAAAPDVPTAAVGADAAGTFFVAWQIPGEEADGERDVIAAQRLAADGTPLEGRITVSRVARGYRAQPRVAVSPGGHALVVWESETDDDPSGASVVARRFDEFGKALGNEFRVSTRAFAFQAEPAVAAHANGAFQVVWASDAQDGDGFGVFGHTTAIEGWVGYRAKATDHPGNRMPRDFNVRLDDLVLADGSADDGENYTVGRSRSLLLSSRARRDESDPARPAYVRYAVGPSREGAGSLDKERIPAAVKHLPRRWEVDNRFGTLVVESRRASALLLPVGLAGEPEPGAAAPAYLCYQIRPMAGELSTQLAGSRFRPDLQVFAGDGFDDCARDRSGATAFAGSAVAGKCLYQIRKPLELCNPVRVDNVEPPRTTSAAIEPVAGSPVASLLCYQVKTATRVNSADAGVQIGRRGQLSPPQSRHARHLDRFGTALQAQPSAGVPAPIELDTLESERLCVATRIRDVARLQ